MKLKILIASAILAIGGAFWTGCGGGACSDLADECGGDDSGCDADNADCAAQCILDNAEDHCDPTKWTTEETTNMSKCLADCG